MKILQEYQHNIVDHKCDVLIQWGLMRLKLPVKVGSKQKSKQENICKCEHIYVNVWLCRLSKVLLVNNGCNYAGKLKQ